jgi:hypothetical protein
MSAQTSMSDLKPGTACHLVNLVQRSQFMGRQVEVIGPYPPPSGETGEWFALRSEWISEEFPGQDFITPRRCLHPIAER